MVHWFISGGVNTGIYRDAVKIIYFKVLGFVCWFGLVFKKDDITFPGKNVRGLLSIWTFWLVVVNYLHLMFLAGRVNLSVQKYLMMQGDCYWWFNYCFDQSFCMGGSTPNKIIILFHLLMSLWSIPNTVSSLSCFPALSWISVFHLTCIMKWDGLLHCFS